MNLIVLLFALGIVLLGFEVIVPGAILGAFGVLSMIGGIVLSFMDFGATGGLISVLVSVVLVGAMVLIEFVVLPKTAVGRRLFLQAAVEGSTHALPADAAATVGSEGSTVTTLAPSGYIQIGTRQYEAFSQSGLLPKGTPIRVVGADNFRLIVVKAQ